MAVPKRLSTQLFSALAATLLCACGDGTISISGSFDSPAATGPGGGSITVSGGSPQGSPSTGGAMTRQSFSPPDTAADSTDETPDESSPESCTELKVTTPRGLACFQCMQPEAQENAGDTIDILRESCLKNVAIAVVVDGSKGFDVESLQERIRTLAAGGRRPFVHLYLTNGPAQRRWKNTPLIGLGTKMSPEKFRRKVIFDPRFEQRIVRGVERVLPIARTTIELDGVVTFALALEDNMSNRVFNRFAEIVENALPPELPIQLVRNSCTSCYPGNEGKVPDGILKESHGLKMPGDLKDGIFSNDGKPDFTDLPSPADAAKRFDELSSLRDLSTERNNTFIVWSAYRQGLKTRGDTLLGFEVPADERTYKRPTAEERQDLILLLRGD